MKLWELILGTGIKGRSMLDVIIVDDKEINIREPKDVLWESGSLGNLKGQDDIDHEDYLMELFNDYNGDSDREIDDEIYDFDKYKDVLLKDVCSSEIELVGENSFKFIVDCYS